MIPQVWSWPPVGTFWSMQLTNQPPLPFLPGFLPADTPVYQLDTNNSYLYDDRNVDYFSLRSTAQTSVTLPPAPGEGGYGGGDTNGFGPGPLGTSWGPNDLWLEIELNAANPGYGDLILHGTTLNTRYQWLRSSSVTEPFPLSPPWTPGQVLKNTLGTNALVLPDVPVPGDTGFFRAVAGETIVAIYPSYAPNVVKEPCSPNDTPEPADFLITVDPTVNHPLTIVYGLTGSADPLTDYTNLTGTVVVAANAAATNITFYPRWDNKLEFQESVTVTLQVTNGYLVDPDNYSATFWIEDCTNYFTFVATNVPAPASIDYHSISNALVIGVNFESGETNNFALVGTNHAVQAWSGVHGILGEVKFTAIRDNSSVFTNGNVYFGNRGYGGIGMLSSDGTYSNLYWCQLSNELDVVNSLYADRTGVWGNDLLAVTANMLGQGPASRGVWRVHSQTNVEQVVRISTDFLEGLLTVPNDSRYGPWAGRLLTADENVHAIYAVETNGSFEAHYLGIDADDFHLIETNQDVYCVCFVGANPHQSTILKVSRNLLVPYVGDILIAQAGEVVPGSATLFIVHWDAVQRKFAIRRLSLPSTLGGHFEHVTVAPVEISDL